MQHDPQAPAAKNAIPDSFKPSIPDRFGQPGDEATFRAWLDCDLPVELEIGSGKGLFLINAAIKNPNRRFVGLKLAGKYANGC